MRPSPKPTAIAARIRSPTIKKVLYRSKKDGGAAAGAGVIGAVAVAGAAGAAAGAGLVGAVAVAGDTGAAAGAGVSGATALAELVGMPRLQASVGSTG